MIQREAEQIIDLLKDEDREQYFKTSIPDTIDNFLDELIGYFIQADEAGRNQIFSKIKMNFADILLSYSRRAAQRSVRESNSKYIAYGLAALVVSEPASDYRERLMKVSMHYHSAVKIGADPNQLFQEAASLANNQASKHILAFLQRPESQKTIAVMGYREENADDLPNFKYVRTWP